jgi:hypothetical protein
MMKLMTLSLLAALLSACSGMPMSGQAGGNSGEKSYAERMSPEWLEWARANNGGP